MNSLRTQNFLFMEMILRFFTTVRVQRSLCVTVALLGMLSAHVSLAQQAEEARAMPAEDIIQILQGNPELLADAKAQIVSRLRDRGYAVTEADVTDERLFSQIRSDDRVRQAVSDELKQRGYGQPEQTETPPTAQKPPAVQPGATAPPVAPAKTAEPKNGQGLQKYYPYRNLPSLQELYVSPTTDPEKLERFGAALFRNSAVSDKTALDVPVGSDYVIGPGDELIADMWGSTSQRLQLTVDRDGRVVLPEAGSILVAGRTLGDAQQLIQKALARQYRDDSVSGTLGKLRMVRAYVVGDVKNPGAYDISALSTSLSALLAAGGPTDTGSLRTVKHYRGKKLVEDIDLYELMLKGVTSAQ